MKLWNKYGWILMSWVVVLISFLHYSPVFYPFFNSDHAIHLLMSYEFRFPEDLYYWGQNRLGSLIPLLTYFVQKISPLPLYWTASLVHYSLVFLGCLALSQLIHSKILKVLLHVIVFLPPRAFPMAIIYSHPYAPHFALFSIAIWGMYRMEKESERKNISSPWTLLLPILVCFSLGMAVWVSDQAVISGFLVCGWIFSLKWIKNKKNPLTSIRQNYHKTILYGVVFILFIAFITYAKSHVPHTPSQDQYAFNSLREIFGFVGQLWHRATRLVFTDQINLFQQLYTCLALVLVGFFSVDFIRQKGKYPIWGTFLVFHSILLIITTLSSHWALINAPNHRYFTIAYLSQGAGWIFWVNGYSGIKKTGATGMLAVLVVAGGMSGVWNQYFPAYKPAKMKTIKEFSRLGQAGIVGNYWNSYIYSSFDPENIVSTAQEHQAGRNKSRGWQTLNQPRIYIIKDNWLTTYPDTLHQFGKTLIKTGTPFQIAGTELVAYKKVSVKRSFVIDSLSHKYMETTSSRDGKNAPPFILDHAPLTSPQLSVTGPWIQLPPGKYTFRYHLQTTDNQKNKKIAELAVTFRGQTKNTYRKSILPSDFPSPHKEKYFDISISSDTPLYGTNFNLFYFGGQPLLFSRLELIEE